MQRSPELFGFRLPPGGGTPGIGRADSCERRGDRCADLIVIEAAASRHLAGDPIEQILGMIGLAQELIDVQGMEGGDVGVEDGSAANQDRLEGLLALDPTANLDSGQQG
jgi:hypothetical protein